jgi:hypothetical protein
MCSPETSIHTRSIRRRSLEDGILHSHRREKLKSYTIYYYYLRRPINFIFITLHWLWRCIKKTSSEIELCVAILLNKFRHVILHLRIVADFWMQGNVSSSYTYRSWFPSIFCDYSCCWYTPRLFITLDYISVSLISCAKCVFINVSGVYFYHIYFIGLRHQPRMRSSSASSSSSL